MTLYTFVLICLGTCRDMSDSPVIVPNLSYGGCNTLIANMKKEVHTYRRFVATCAEQGSKTPQLVEKP